MEQRDRVIRGAVDEICRQLADSGKLIEAGWRSMELTVVPPSASPEQIDALRMAFYFGAQHLFASIMGIMEPDREPTENDMRRMSQISAELDGFLAEMKGRAASEAGQN